MSELRLVGPRENGEVAKGNTPPAKRMEKEKLTGRELKVETLTDRHVGSGARRFVLYRCRSYHYQ